MMRIAVAGGGGLGYMLATGISQAANAYNVIILSRYARPEFAQFDVQVQVVDYRDPSSLSYALQGIDLVISTVSGPEQLSLIHAAGQGRVRYFVPAEFEGSLDHRPSGHDALRPDSPDALELLHRWSQVSRMRSTVFSCGVFMERFHPYGLASLNIGLGSGVSSAGTYLVDVSGAAAEYADRGASGSSSHICLTSVYDLVRFVIAAIDVGPKHWPKEFTLRGDRLSVRDVVDTCSYVRNSSFTRQIRSYADLQAHLNYYLQLSNIERVSYYQRLLATADGRYDFRRPTLNAVIENSDVVTVRPLNFREWLASVWQSP